MRDGLGARVVPLAQGVPPTGARAVRRPRGNVTCRTIRVFSCQRVRGVDQVRGGSTPTGNGSVRSRWRRLAGLLASCLVVATTVARADVAELPLRFEGQWWHYDADRGLPQNSVMAMAVDRDGYLWVGTFGGLARYDGLQFHFHPSRPDLGPPSDRISALHRDAQGRIWIGTENAGLGRYEPGVGFMRPRAGCVDPCRIRQIVGDRDGRLLVAGDDGVFWVADDFSVEAVHAPTLADPHTAAIDHEGRIWLANLAVYLPPDGGAPIRLPDGDEVHRLQAVGGRVFASGKQLWRLDTGRGAVPAFGGSDLPRAFAIAGSAETGWWIGNEAGGIWQVEPGGSEARPVAFRLDGRRVRAILVEAGTLWVGSDGGGLHRLPSARVGAMGGLGTVLPSATMALLVDRDDRLWIGSFCDGLYRRDADGRLRSFGLPDGDYDCIWSLATGPSGDIWVSHGGGRVERLDAEGRHLEQWLIDRDPRIRAIHVDASGTVWLGGSLGLYRLDERRLFVHQSGFPRAEIATLREARNGGLWIGSGQGLFHWDGARVTRSIGIADGLRSAFVRAVHEEPDGVLWVGTYGGGLHRWQDGVIRAYGVPEGLSEDFISCIAEDAYGHVWLSGNRGLSRIARASLDAAPEQLLTPTLYTRNEGLPTSESNGGGSASCARFADGRLLFALISGIGVVDPTRLRDERPPPGPPVDLLEARINGVKSAVQGPLALPSTPATLALRFTASSLDGGERLQFRYRLDGRDWNEVGSIREILLTDLPFGRHRVEVAARIDGGAWTVEPLAVLVNRPAPWYLDRTLHGALLVMAALAMWAVVRVRTASLRHRAARLDELVAERTRQLVVANDKLERLARTDGLTGLANRRAFDERLRAEWTRAVRQGSLLGLIVFDVDAFKAYNDTYGHPAGDRCLRRLGVVAEALVRGPGAAAPRGAGEVLLARLGGEEFGVLLRDPPAGASEALAERLRAGIAALAIPHRGSPAADVVTISLGVAVLAPQRDGTPHDIVALADAALYRAKQNGRNQVALAAPA